MAVLEFGGNSLAYSLVTSLKYEVINVCLQSYFRGLYINGLEISVVYLFKK